MLVRSSAGNSPCTTTSGTAKRPPGLSTREASRSTVGLSPLRLMTQLEMMTSTLSFGQRDLFDVTLQEAHVLDATFLTILLGERQHLVGHVEAVDLAGWTYAPG